MARLGIWIAQWLGNPCIDPVASILIGLLLVGAAWTPARQTGDLLAAPAWTRNGPGN